MASSSSTNDLPASHLELPPLRRADIPLDLGPSLKILLNKTAGKRRASRSLSPPAKRIHTPASGCGLRPHTQATSPATTSHAKLTDRRVDAIPQPVTAASTHHEVSPLGYQALALTPNPVRFHILLQHI